MTAEKCDYVWTGTAWVALPGVPVTETISYESGWSLKAGTVDLLPYYLALAVTFRKTSKISSGDTVGTVAHPPATAIQMPGTMSGVSTYNYCIVQVDTSGGIRPFFGGSTVETDLSLNGHFRL